MMSRGGSSKGLGVKAVGCGCSAVKCRLRGLKIGGESRERVGCECCKVVGRAGKCWELGVLGSG